MARRTGLASLAAVTVAGALLGASAASAAAAPAAATTWGVPWPGRGGTQVGPFATYQACQAARVADTRTTSWCYNGGLPLERPRFYYTAY